MPQEQNKTAPLARLAEALGKPTTSKAMHRVCSALSSQGIRVGSTDPRELMEAARLARQEISVVVPAKRAYVAHLDVGLEAQLAAPIAKARLFSGEQPQV